MYQLLLDSANKFLSVGLAKDKKVIDKIYYEAWQRQSEKMVEEIDNILKRNNVSKSDLDAIVLGIGPGSYTGVRIAITIAKTIAYALKIKIYAVSSLSLLKDNDKPSFCIFNARSGRSYVGVFHKNKIITSDCVMSNDDLLKYIHENPTYVINGDVEHLGLKTNSFDIFENMVNSIRDENIAKDIFNINPLYLKDLKKNENH